MRSIYCALDLFDTDQHIYVCDKSTNQTAFLMNSRIENFAKNIAFQCNDLGIKNVHLYGDEIYLEPIVEDIKELGKLEYSCDDIIVEVN